MRSRVNMDEYKNGRTEIYKNEHAIVTLHFPDLTPEERERRHTLLEKALSDFYHTAIASGVDWDKYVIPPVTSGEEET